MSSDRADRSKTTASSVRIPVSFSGEHSLRPNSQDLRPPWTYVRMYHPPQPWRERQKRYVLACARYAWSLTGRAYLRARGKQMMLHGFVLGLQLILFLAAYFFLRLRAAYRRIKRFQS